MSNFFSFTVNFEYFIEIRSNNLKMYPGYLSYYKWLFHKHYRQFSYLSLLHFLKHLRK